ncbi:hypothetical protein M422DRAFT_275833 [Sphaerobolus stellatus SS14]|uniref:Uncharacterized protein n=1 Tax=Sphaerobolus stellatus (strain SS14) TaxID=990650 RepID=A0A0C9TNU0_SPHS4|nr:hypothetical protein M422DRAFT_275833 [Sphaerobolus stellatus SS14]
MPPSSEQVHSSIEPTQVKGLISKKLVVTAFLSLLNFYTNLFSPKHWAGELASLTWATMVKQIVKGWPIDCQDYLPLLTQVVKCMDTLDAGISKGINKSTFAVALGLDDMPASPINKLSTQQLKSEHTSILEFQCRNNSELNLPSVAKYCNLKEEMLWKFIGMFLAIATPLKLSDPAPSNSLSPTPAAPTLAPPTSPKASANLITPAMRISPPRHVALLPEVSTLVNSNELTGHVLSSVQN